MILDYIDITYLACPSIAATSWTIILIHIRRGNKNKWLTRVTIILLTSQVAYLTRYINAILAYYKWGYWTVFTLVLNGVSWGI